MSADQIASDYAKRLAAERNNDPRVELAIHRTELAIERTQLAWVRTTFSLYTAGIALDKGLEALHQARMLQGSNWVQTGHSAGIFLALLGTVLSALTTYVYYRRIRDLAIVKGSPMTYILPAGWLSFIASILGVPLIVFMLSGD